ncbi:unnamed protein product [Adineta steineri]|uniref:Membrane-bound transcription factor site-1 protease n=1 Tax=Adineta steineri TaxID=433720 RepID=A0A818MRJ9_9BILA|nr:unnamed protein product [Adineta steineri]
MAGASVILIFAGVVLSLITIVSLLIASMGRLNTDQIAISYNMISKKLSRDVQASGLHLNAPGFKFIIFPSVFTSMEFDDISCLNHDGVSINLDVTLQFQADPKHLYDIVLQFKDFEGYKKILYATGRAAVHDTCAHFNTTAFQSMRGYFQVKLLEEMKGTFSPFYAILRDLQVNNVRRPGDFETAVKDKEAAKENIKIAENERPKLLTQARTEYQKALKQAQIIKERADTDSNIILNQADAEAQAVRTRYTLETDTYAELKRKMQLSVESLLNYMAIRVIGSSKNDVYINLKSPAQIMSIKRKFSEDNNNEHDNKQRQRMTTYHLNNIFQTTQQKLYDGSKNFFRKLKDSTISNETKSLPIISCCSSMHCTIPIVSICDYCEKQYCSNHLTPCLQCNKTYCPYCSTNIDEILPCNITADQNEQKINVQYKTKPIQDEFIIQFTGYYNTITRSNYLTRVFERNHVSYEIIQRNNLLQHYPSDFDIVRFSGDEQIINALKKHPVIRAINPHRQILRYIQYSTIEEDEEITGNKRKLHRSPSNHIRIAESLQAPKLWKMGHRGAGIHVAVFDTGIQDGHPHFPNIAEVTNWTDEKNDHDTIGHGLFVAGVIGSNKECLGIAPEAQLHIFKVFTNNHISYTSWFLDAFNYAIIKKVHVLNLSIGGPDFMDQPFIDKVWDLTSNGIILVSAIGNDGPLYGTLNNPADQMDVIGVGSITVDDAISRFSSRGMTTWELPAGYGRMKPDLVTYGSFVRGSNLVSGCKVLSGTSVASPVVAGAVALLASSVLHRTPNIINPATLKQALLASAHRIRHANMFEQGHGKLNLLRAFRILNQYVPQASLSPSYIDFTECPYFWPYCLQPLYHSAIPIIVNVTILNGMDVVGEVVGQPQWHPQDLYGQYLALSFNFSTKLWPWSGYLAISMSIHQNASNFEGIVQGHVTLTIESPAKDSESFVQRSDLILPVRVRIIPTPIRSHRILWDQYHSIGYPPGYFPRDDLKQKNDPLDWNADHIHTNFRHVYEHLRNAGYFIEVLGQPYTCFDASLYGTLLIVDPEEEFFVEEISKLHNDVVNKSLSLIVFADWYNVSVMKRVQFYDENTRQWWLPETGGANLPALNNLLKPLGIALGDTILEGNFDLGEHMIYYASGTHIVQFPADGYLIYRPLNDQGEAIMQMPISPHMPQQRHLNLDNHENRKKHKIDIESIIKPRPVSMPILGLVESSGGGRVAIYGDSNCIDSVHLVRDCYWLLLALLEFTTSSRVPKLFLQLDENKQMDLPVPELERLNTSRLHKFSRVIEKNDLDNTTKQRKLPQCFINTPTKPSEPLVINLSPQNNIMRYQNHLMANEDDNIDTNVIIDSSESSSHLSRVFFNLKNPIFIPSLFGSFGVLCVFIILCRTRLYRILIMIIYGNGFYNRKSNSSRLKPMSKHRQYHSMSSLSKP